MWKKRLFEDTSKKNDGNCVCVCSYYYYFFKGRWLQNAWKLSPTTPLTPPTLRGMARVPNFRTPLLLFELNLILQAFVLWREHLEGAQGQGDSSVCVKADFCKFFVFLRPTEMGSWQQLSACHTMRPCLSVSCSVHLEERKSLRGRSSALLRYSLPMQCRTPPLYSVGVCRLCCSAMYFLIRVMQWDSAAQQTSGLRSSASL